MTHQERIHALQDALERAANVLALLAAFDPTEIAEVKVIARRESEAARASLAKLRLPT